MDEATSNLSPERLREQPSQILDNEYPEVFRPLISGILALRRDDNDGWILFEDLRKLAGDKKMLKENGWCTYTSFVNRARDQMVLEMRVAENKEQEVKLRSLEVWKAYIKSLTLSEFILSTCPTGHGGSYAIVKAILQLTGGDIAGKVPINDLIGVLFKTPDEMETVKVQGVTFGQLVKLTSEGGWIRKGTFKGQQCIWLGPKVGERGRGYTQTGTESPETEWLTAA